eukprot:scaffold33373_cov43-Prasinocladus_malaysianus.AAC.1
MRTSSVRRNSIDTAVRYRTRWYEYEQYDFISWYGKLRYRTSTGSPTRIPILVRIRVLESFANWVRIPQRVW